MSKEIYLGNWGTIVCHSTEQMDYLIAAYNYSEISKSVQSWEGHWLSPEMEAAYKKSLEDARIKSENLWEKVPNRSKVKPALLRFV